MEQMKENESAAAGPNPGPNPGPITGPITGSNPGSNTGPNTGSNTGSNIGSNTGSGGALSMSSLGSGLVMSLTHSESSSPFYKALVSRTEKWAVTPRQDLKLVRKLFPDATLAADNADAAADNADADAEITEQEKDLIDVVEEQLEKTKQMFDDEEDTRTFIHNMIQGKYLDTLVTLREHHMTESGMAPSPP